MFPRHRRLIRFLLTAFSSAACIYILTARQSPVAAAPTTAPSITFTTHIAPIIFQHCAVCHHPGASAPFALLTYADVQHRGKQIAQVVGDRIMPPWQPEGDFGQFVGDRRLNADQIDLIRAWIANGAPEGPPDSAPVPAAPTFTDGWHLGPPDLVIELPTPYTLPPDGRDIYRNFALPTSTTARKFIRAVELDPGNGRVMHHAFLMIDVTGTSRRRNNADGSPGYTGMDAGADALPPPGQMLSWQPGKRRCLETDRFPWLLPRGADLVLQMHLRPTGKPETVRPRIGLYFTDRPPAAFPYTIVLSATSIDIPPGDANYEVHRSYELPVDVQLLSILPHAHYIGRRAEAWAVLPGGVRQMLIRLNDWDFNWQSDYEYATPVRLPKGTILHFSWSYDNTDKNARNPHHPPARVTYGPNSDDEMAEMNLQVLPDNAKDFHTLAADCEAKIIVPGGLERAAFVAKLNPSSAAAHANLATILLDAARTNQAISEIQATFQIDPNNPLAHRCVATIASGRGDWAQAATQYALALRGDPNDYRSMCNLGLMLAIQGKLDEGVAALEASVRLNPNAPLTHANLARVLNLQNKLDAARRELDAARELEPQDPFLQQVSEELRLHPGGK